MRSGIDVAMHLARVRRLGIPQESRDAFTLLEQAKLIPGDLSQRLQAMVGFRNIAIHDYQKLNLEIVRSVLSEHLADFAAYGQCLLALSDHSG